MTDESGRDMGNVHQTRVGHTKADEEFREAVRDLAGKTLGCWCQRLENDQPPCHAEVIAEHADRLAEEQPAMADGGRPAEGVDQWWGCPSQGCEGLTRVCHYPDGKIERECQECDWSYELPTETEVTYP
jgi:hypothetical protein